MPAKDLQGQREGHGAPQHDDGDLAPDRGQAPPLQHHGPQGVVERGQRKGLDDGLGGLRKALGGEEDSDNRNLRHTVMHECSTFVSSGRCVFFLMILLRINCSSCDIFDCMCANVIP